MINLHIIPDTYLDLNLPQNIYETSIFDDLMRIKFDIYVKSLNFNLNFSNNAFKVCFNFQMLLTLTKILVLVSRKK